MTRRVGTIEELPDGSNRVWQRCHICGDSQKRKNIGHMVVNQATGRYHCFRCAANGVLATFIPKWPEPSLIDRVISATPGNTKKVEISARTSGRPSLLANQYKVGPADVFFSTSGGYQVVKDGTKLSYGPLRQGLGVPAFNPNLKSSPDWPLVVVEGPYDVLDGFTDVCIFGAVPTLAQLAMLAGRYVIIRPDGDVWQEDKRGLLVGILRAWRHSKAIVLGVERLPDGLDPDEADDPGDLLTLSQVGKWINEQAIKESWRRFAV